MLVAAGFAAAAEAVAAEVVAAEEMVVVAVVAQLAYHWALALRLSALLPILLPAQLHQVLAGLGTPWLHSMVHPVASA